jgi:DNA-directed RNA polymerase subunit M/transcription elongation factor TFIIS
MPFRALLKVVSATQPARETCRRAADEISQQPPTAPECPRCGIVMRWFQSRLERNGAESIVHSFYCENCARVADVRESLKKASEPLVA